MRRRGLNVTRRRAQLVGLLFVGSLWFGLPGAPVAAQVTTIETVPLDVDDEGRTAGERIDQVVVMLRILGAVVVVTTAVYWWRTRPAAVESVGLPVEDLLNEPEDELVDLSVGGSEPDEEVPR